LLGSLDNDTHDYGTVPLSWIFHCVSWTPRACCVFFSFKPKHQLAVKLMLRVSNQMAPLHRSCVTTIVLIPCFSNCCCCPAAVTWHHVDRYRSAVSNFPAHCSVLCYNDHCILRHFFGDREELLETTTCVSKYRLETLTNIYRFIMHVSIFQHL